MKLNFLKTIRDRREQRRRLRELRQMTETSVTLDRLMGSGVINWNPKLRQMLISEPLALLMLQSTEKWQNFVRNLYLWTYARECNQAWEDYFHKEELMAVRKALKENQNLTRDDIDRIRRARRQEIALSDVTPPQVKPFEFLVIPDSTEAAPKPVFVGWFNPETEQQELALWSEVEPFLKGKSE